MKYDMLFSPMNIGSVTIKNRLVMAPMLMGFGTFNGTVTEQMSDYYEERAKGGMGLIITEITRVDDKTGASAFAQLAMSHDYQIEPLRGMVEKIHSHGAKLFVQLHHPGRQNMGLLIGTVPLSIGMDKRFSFYSKLLYGIVPAGKVLMEKHLVPRVVSPSKCENAYFADGNNRALSKKEIKKLINEFIDAAQRVKKSGADGVELHASHGYLIQQFLSPYTNRRTDEYGGSLENRMRFLLEILTGIKERCGSDFPVIVRLTVDECYDRIGKPGVGYSLNEGVMMAQRIEKAGADAIDVSSAGYDTFNYWLEPTSFECGWRKYMAAAVKAKVTIPVLAANLIRSPEQAEKQLEEGTQDFISLGRPTIADPHWAEKAQQGRAEDISRCICCLYCIESMQNNAYIGGHGGCSVNPFVGNESTVLKNNGGGKTVAVVGAGPAGLMAARLLCLRGFDCVVFEKEQAAGGQLRLAAAPSLKEKINWCIEDMLTAAEKAGARIKLGTEATEESIAALNPHAVVVATGGFAVRPRSIKGADGENVFTVTEILNGSHLPKGKQVAVIGSGMTGLETAEMLCENGNKVTVIEMADSIAPGTWMQHIDDALPRLRAAGAKILTSRKLVEITPDGIVVEGTGKKAVRKSLACDEVVLSLGVRSENKLYEEIKDKFQNVYLIGDAEKPGRIADATHAAFDCAMKME